jgi:predicted transcriptional regulator
MGGQKELVLDVPSNNTQDVLRAINNNARFEILRLLFANPMNVSDLARALGISQPTVTTYVKQLEDAGLIFTHLTKSQNGYIKMCHTPYAGISITWQEVLDQIQETSYELDMPVGHYSAIDCSEPCLLATQAGIIASSDDYSLFFHPIRMEAELLQIGQGRVSYLFPYNVPEAHRLISLELSAELSLASVASNTAADFVLLVNRHEYGPFRLTVGRPYETERNRLGWYPAELPPSGELFVWRIDEHHIRLNEKHLGPVSLADLHLQPMQPIEVSFIVSSVGELPSGMILFGKSFGRYNQDIRLTISYEQEKRQTDSGDN